MLPPIMQWYCTGDLEIMVQCLGYVLLGVEGLMFALTLNPKKTVSSVFPILVHRYITTFKGMKLPSTGLYGQGSGR